MILLQPVVEKYLYVHSCGYRPLAIRDESLPRLLAMAQTRQGDNEPEPRRSAANSCRHVHLGGGISDR